MGHRTNDGVKKDVGETEIMDKYISGDISQMYKKTSVKYTARSVTDRLRSTKYR